MTIITIDVIIIDTDYDATNKTVSDNKTNGIIAVTRIAFNVVDSTCIDVTIVIKNMVVSSLLDDTVIIANGIVVVARDSNAATTSDGACNNNTGATICIDVAKCNNHAIISTGATISIDVAKQNKNATMSIDVARNDETAIIIVDHIVAVGVTSSIDTAVACSNNDHNTILYY